MSEDVDVWQVADSKGTIREMNGSEEEHDMFLQQMVEFYGKNWTWEQQDRYIERSPVMKEWRLAMKRWRHRFGPANMKLLEGKETVSYLTAAQYLDCSLEMVRGLTKKQKLESQGEGHQKKITKASLIKRRPA